MAAKRLPINNFRRANARRLRTNATGTEMRLWKRLRTIPTFGTHFRRQVPIGPYIADFACMAARLVIELDGSQHAAEEMRSRDQQRTRWLESQGYRVIRFWNNEIVRDLDGVLERVYAALYGSADAEHHFWKHKQNRR
jgi:very-short-patch-repair endonuclease